MCRLLMLSLGALMMLNVQQAVAQEAAAEEPLTPEKVMQAVNEAIVDADTLWVMVAACLVFFMQAGFALVESGLTRAKNCVNICMKNLLDFCFASIAFFFVGFALMFGKGNGFIGTSGFMLKEVAEDTFGSLSWATVPLEIKFFFQLVFAGTAATIVSGAMSERTKFSCYMIYSLIIALVIYPISGHWVWGGGFLAPGGDGAWFGDDGFYDFAGSTIVHSVGGWLALIGALVVGPRLGKYGPDGRVNAIPGHNFPIMMLGVFILWLGWFGFNPGSTMDLVGSGATIAHIAVTTNAGAVAGTIGALLTSRLWFGKWDASMAGNGCLAGLVAVTAPCAWVTTPVALLIGLLGGILVVCSVVFIDRVLKIDDPVGASSVHLVCGMWGTIAVGLFADPQYEGPTGLFYGGGITQLKIQIIGILVYGVWCVVTGFTLFGILRAVMGLRVTREEEIRGLDVDEHGMEAYPDFQTIDRTHVGDGSAFGGALGATAAARSPERVAVGSVGA